jgi:hypothetical protein
VVIKFNLLYLWNTSSQDFIMLMGGGVQESEVKDALKRMKGGKTMGPDGIYLLKCGGVLKT